MSKWAQLSPTENANIQRVSQVIDTDPAGRYAPDVLWGVCPDETQQGWLLEAGIYTEAIIEDVPAENLNIALGEDYIEAGEALDTADAVRTKTGSVGVITDRPAFDTFMVSSYLAVDTGTQPDPVPNTLYQALKLGSKSQVELHRDADNVWCKLWGNPNGLECRFEAGFSNAFSDTGLGYWIATGLPERADVIFMQDGVEISEAIIIPGSAEDPLATHVWHGVPAVPYTEEAGFVANVDGDKYPDTLVVELPGGGKVYKDADSLHVDSDGSGRANVSVPR